MTETGESSFEGFWNRPQFHANLVSQSKGTHRARPPFPMFKLCKTPKCDFYGTPQCENYCSQCWHEYQLQKKRAQQYNKNKLLLQESLLGGDDRRKSSSSGTLRSLTSKSTSMGIFSSPNDCKHTGSTPCMI